MSEAALDHSTAGSRRGRPPLARPFELFLTLTLIDSWQRTAFWLAQQEAVTEAAFMEMMTQAKVPPELWDKTRAVIGRHRPYDPAPGLTERQRQRLAALEDLLTSKPSDRWTTTDRRRERAKLRAKLHGKAAIRQIEDPIQGIKGGISAPGLAVITTLLTPRYLRGLWLAFDEWGGRQHRMAAKTFRDHRRKLQRSDDPLFRSLRRERVPPPHHPQQHRAR